MSKFFQMIIQPSNEDKPLLVQSDDRRALENHASKFDYDFYRIEKNGKYISGVDYRKPKSFLLPQRTHC